MLNASYVTCRLHVCIRYYVSQQRPGLNLSEPQPHVRNSTTAPTVWTFFLCKKIFFMSQFNHQLLGFITPLYLAFHTCQNTSNLSECGFFSPSLGGIFKWPENGPKKLLRIELEVSLSDKKKSKNHRCNVCSKDNNNKKYTRSSHLRSWNQPFFYIKKSEHHILPLRKLKVQMFCFKNDWNHYMILKLLLYR